MGEQQVGVAAERAAAARIAAEAAVQLDLVLDAYEGATKEKSIADKRFIVEAPVANIDIGVAFFFFMAVALAGRRMRLARRDRRRRRGGRRCRRWRG